MAAFHSKWRPVLTWLSWQGNWYVINASTILLKIKEVNQDISVNYEALIIDSAIPLYCARYLLAPAARWPNKCEHFDKQAFLTALHVFGLILFILLGFCKYKSIKTMGTQAHIYFVNDSTNILINNMHVRDTCTRWLHVNLYDFVKVEILRNHAGTTCNSVCGQKDHYR